MKKLSVTIPAVLAVTGVVVAGCSSSEAGDPEPGTGSTAATSADGSLPHSGAPSVAQPIDTQRWQADPCSVITAQQFSSIGLDDVDAEPNPNAMAGPTCDWYPADATLAGFGGGFVTAHPPTEGLSRIYERHKLGEYKVWQELEPIAGHPAVRADTKDESGQGMCGLAVGVRDDLVYSVLITDEDKEITKDPCAFAQKVATLAVETMKGGA